MGTTATTWGPGAALGGTRATQWRPKEAGGGCKAATRSGLRRRSHAGTLCTGEVKTQGAVTPPQANVQSAVAARPALQDVGVCMLQLACQPHSRDMYPVQRVHSA
jgi:hypothetical protein